MIRQKRHVIWAERTLSMISCRWEFSQNINGIYGHSNLQVVYSPHVTLCLFTSHFQSFGALKIFLSVQKKEVNKTFSLIIPFWMLLWKPTFFGQLDVYGRWLNKCGLFWCFIFILSRSRKDRFVSRARGIQLKTNYRHKQWGMTCVCVFV